MGVTSIVLATRNQGKISEFRRLLSSVSLEIHTPEDFPNGPEVAETAATLEGNARLKAQAWRDHTGLPALADDTGLEVDLLDGRPGVLSARFAGVGATDAMNRTLLLEQLRDHPDAASRTARFRTVIVFAGEVEEAFHGVCDGLITPHECGDGGFGYDCVFQPTAEARTFAEMTADEKNLISHRGKALRRATAWLSKMVESEE